MPSPRQSAARLRERRYRSVAADPFIAARTHFFRAAVIVSRTLATRDHPPFLAELGARLEVANLRRARQIRAGRLYRDGSADANTADFVRFEQALVQAELEKLLRRDAHAYDELVACANAQISRAATGIARWLNRRFARAVHATRAQLGREVDFGRRADRELLGNAIVRESLR